MSAGRVNKASTELLVFVVILFVLLLTSVNIDNYLIAKKVLGIQTQKYSNEEFWKNFLDKNPNYIAGWLEIGRTDKVKEIDPNYIMP